MPPKVKNQTKPKMSNGDALASSIRPTIRKPIKPTTPNTVTTSSAVDAVHIFDLLAIQINKGWSQGQ
jgi:hypothetical protein